MQQFFCCWTTDSLWIRT